MEFEHIEYKRGLPFKSFVVRIGHRSHHLHSELEIIYVLDGEVKIDLGANIYHLKTNDTFIINPYQIHSIESVEHPHILLILQANLRQVFEGKSNIRFIDPVVKNNSNISKLMCSIHLKTLDESLSADYYLNGYLNILIGELFENIPFQHLNSHMSTEKSETYSRLKTIIHYVEHHHHERLSLQNLADFVHLSKYHLSHFIKKQLGITFQDYFNNVRLSHALKLICYSQESILNIAMQSGFSDIKYLNALIKKKYGCTASALRKKLPTYDFLMKDAPIGSLHLPFDFEKAKEILQTNQITF